MAKRFSTPGSSLGNANQSSVPVSLFVLLALSLVLTIVGVREGEAGPLHAARGVVQAIVSPVRTLGATIASPIAGVGNVVGNLTADSETLSELTDENAQLKAEVARLTEYEADAENLMGLLQLRDTYKLTSTAARVISQSTDSWSSTITIDKGSNDGFAVGMPVMGSAGVIGQISECGPATSVVRLISDESSGVSSMVQSSRAQGQLTGSADGQLRLTLVRTNQQVAVGDSVVTSGLGGTYPKGLPVGTVTNVTKAEGAMYYEITVEPLSDVKNLQEVLVITSVEDDQQATEDDAAEADAQDRSTVAATTATTDDASGTDSTDTSDSSEGGQ